MLSWMAGALMVQLADIDAVAQQIGEGAIGQRHAADGSARAERPQSRHDATLPQLALQDGEGSQREIAPEDQPDGFGLVLPDDELAVAHLISERDDAADPDAPALRGGNLVADALARDLTLELSEGQEHVEGQPAHAARSLE